MQRLRKIARAYTLFHSLEQREEDVINNDENHNLSKSVGRERKQSNGLSPLYYMHT